MKSTSTFMPFSEAMMPEEVIEVYHIRMGATTERGRRGRLFVGINHEMTLDFGGNIETLRCFSAYVADAVDKLEAQGKTP